MTNAISTAKRGSKHSPNWFILLSAMAIIAAANMALMVAMIGMLNWKESVVLILVAAALTGGALFTAWTMRDLNR